ncbi:MAG: hypothetical protein CAF42_000385 [Nitrospira sp. CG24B]|nr:MAG: hypothetical protein CAF42_000385 [Nitrospira sp. CG24B]
MPNLIPVIASAQQTAKQFDKPLSLNAEEQRDIHDHMIESIRLQSMWMTLMAEPISEKRSRFFFEQILSNDWLSPDARPAFDRMLTPHLPNLRTMFPQVEQQARKELERRRQTLPNASWLELDESPAIVRPVSYPNPPTLKRFFPSGHAAPNRDPQLTLVDGPMGGAMHTGGGSMTQSSDKGSATVSMTLDTLAVDNEHVGSDDGYGFGVDAEAKDKSVSGGGKFGMKIRAVVPRCPTAEGIVSGDAQLTVDLSSSVTEGGQTTISRKVESVTAQTEGQVTDEARLKEIRVDVTLVSEMTSRGGGLVRHAAAEATTVRATVKAVLDPGGGILQMSAPTCTVSQGTLGMSGVLDGDCLSMARKGVDIIAYLAKKAYGEAEEKWNKPDDQQNGSECVKLHFTPPTKTEEVAPGQSTDVKAEIRTVKSAQPTWGRLSEIEDYRGGHASPASVGTAPSTPAVFRFVAPSDLGDPNDPPGFYVNKGTSRAGRIKSKNLWQIAALSLVLEFDSMIVGTVQYGKSHARAVVPLRYTRERGYVGQGPLYYETVPSLMAPCIVIVEGKGVTTFDVTAGLPQQRNGAVVDYGLFIRPGDTDEIGRVIPCKGPPPPPVPTAFWSGLFNITRFMTFNWQLAGFPVKGWTIVNQGDVLATKTMKTTCNKLCNEVTTMTLRRKSSQTAQPTGSGGP